MMEIKDYQIIQRDEKDQAKVCFSGRLPEDAPGDVHVVARVFEEQDNLTVVDYMPCLVRGGRWEVQMVLPAGGLYSFEAKLVANELENLHWSRRIRLIRHFGVGDLYLLTGRSAGDMAFMFMKSKGNGER